MLTCWCRWWLSHHTPGRSPKRTLGIGPFAENMWLASDFLKANIAVRSTKVVRKSKTKSCVQFMKLDWSLRVQQTNTTTFFCIVHPCLVHVRLVMPTIQRQWPEGERVGFTAVSDGLQKVIVHSSKAQMFWCLRHLSFWSTESDANQPCQFGQTYCGQIRRTHMWALPICPLFFWITIIYCTFSDLGIQEMTVTTARHGSDQSNNSYL